MHDRKPLIGIIDSGVDWSLLSSVYRGRGFQLDKDSNVYRSADFLDQFNHGTQTAIAILSHLPQAQLCVAKVFSEGLATSALQVTSALEWMIEQDVKLVNMSIGLISDRPSIRNVCKEASARGIVLVASSPAHGEAVYPASYSSVTSVTGDARCAEQQCSYLQSSQAEFGACVRSNTRGIAGASIAAAHFTGLIAKTAVAANTDYRAALAQLRQSADIRGSDKTPWLGPDAQKIKHS